MKNNPKINYKTLLRIHQLGDTLVFVFKFKIMKFKGKKFIGTSLYPTQVLWRTGKVIWQNNRHRQVPLGVDK